MAKNVQPGSENPSPVTLVDGELAQMSKNERIKAASSGLFLVGDGTSPGHPFQQEVEGLSSGERTTLSGQAKELSKFFGAYQQQGREAGGRKTGDHFFMVRIKLPAGGELSRGQWQALDEAADQFADGTLRITSRQALQYHHVYGPKLAPLIRHLNRAYSRGGTLGACGDVNRNVMCSPVADLDPLHNPGSTELARELAEQLAPRSSAYFQIWLSDEQGGRGTVLNPDEPLYGEQYLPRKFKIGIAHPTDNSVDLLTHDVGFMPVLRGGVSDGELWDLYSGGGLGLSHNNPRTRALLGLYLGRVRRDQIVSAVKGIVLLQKENGDRKDRRQARWKYTIRRLGLEKVRGELASRFGIDLEQAEPEPLPPMRLHLGWHAQRGGGYYYGISVESGRIREPLRRALAAAVREFGLSVRLTPQQDLLLCDIEDRAAIDEILREAGIETPSAVRGNAMACPAKPTCGLAMTEAERILPRYIDAVEAAGFGGVDAVIRMTGCPNNCARPPTAEIGIYGYGKNDHVILVGGSRAGTRLAQPLYDRLPESQMIPALVGLFRAINEHKPEELSVGDFLHQTEPEELRRWIDLPDTGC